jgi:hypothetical protein
MDAAASKRTMNTTIGSASVRSLPWLRKDLHLPAVGFRFPTRITACWLAVRRYGGALWSTAPGKKQSLRSRSIAIFKDPDGNQFALSSKGKQK